jgi:hypothetical protein
MTITCTVPGCQNFGIEIETPEYVEVDGEQIPVGTVVCGGCGTQTELPPQTGVDGAL